MKKGSTMLETSVFWCQSSKEWHRLRARSSHTVWHVLNINYLPAGTDTATTSLLGGLHEWYRGLTPTGKKQHQYQACIWVHVASVLTCQMQMHINTVATVAADLAPFPNLQPSCHCKCPHTLIPTHLSFYAGGSKVVEVWPTVSWHVSVMINP